MVSPYSDAAVAIFRTKTWQRLSFVEPQSTATLSTTLKARNIQWPTVYTKDKLSSSPMPTIHIFSTRLARKPFCHIKRLVTFNRFPRPSKRPTFCRPSSFGTQVKLMMQTVTNTLLWRLLLSFWILPSLWFVIIKEFYSPYLFKILFSFTFRYLSPGIGPL